MEHYILTQSEFQCCECDYELDSELKDKIFEVTHKLKEDVVEIWLLNVKKEIKYLYL